MIPPRIIGYLAVSFAAILGIYARFNGLGLWPLSDDEYHTVASVQNILDSGLPAFKCGGYYTRGILYQYLLAFVSFASNIQDVLLLRSVSVVSNILCIPPLFYLANKLGGRMIAWAAVILFLLSVWEVEYARYIRMYALFQTIFVLYLCFLYRVLVEGDKSSIKWMYSISLISILVYEAGIFLIVLNFLPLFLGRAKLSGINVVIPLVALVAAYTFLTFDLRHLGVGNYLPADATLQTTQSVLAVGSLLLPNAFLYSVHLFPGWYALFYLLLIITTGIAYLVLRSKEIDYRKKSFLLLWILLALINQYALIVYTLVIFWLLGLISYQDTKHRITLYFCISVFITGTFWIFFATNTTAWYSLVHAEASNLLRKTFVMFLKYPNIIDKILRPWHAGIPVTSIASGFLVVTGVFLGIRYKNSQRIKIYHLLLAVILILGILVGITTQPYQSSRYTFFMYPLWILVVVFSIMLIISNITKVKIKQSYLFILGIISYVAIADDYDFNHLVHTDSAEINYRTVYDTGRTFHLINRMDFKSPAEFINKSMANDDIVISTVRPVHEYLEKLDYFYIDEKGRGFAGISACAGEKELWTNAGLIYKRDEFLEYIKNIQSPTWLIIRSDEFPFQDSVESEISSQYRDQRVFISTDRSIAVYRFE